MYFFNSSYLFFCKHVFLFQSFSGTSKLNWINCFRQIVLQIRSVRNLSFYARRNWLVDGSSYK